MKYSSPDTTKVKPITIDRLETEETTEETRRTQRMEENARLHDQHADNLPRQEGPGELSLTPPDIRLVLGEDDSLANVLDEEGHEDAGHDNGRRGGFVPELAEAFVFEHEGCVRV